MFEVRRGRFGRELRRWMYGPGVFGLVASMLVACGGAKSCGSVGCGRSEGGKPVAPRPEGCAVRKQAPRPLPSVKAEHLSLSYWLKRLETAESSGQGRVGSAGEVLLSAEAIRRHNAALRDKRNARHGPRAQPKLAEALTKKQLREELKVRADYLREKWQNKKVVDGDGDAIAFNEAWKAPPRDALKSPGVMRVVLESTALRCSPWPAPYYKPGSDKRFDRNLCSTLRPQELVEVLGVWDEKTWLVRAPYAVGWMARDTALSPALKGDLRRRFIEAPRIYVHEDQGKLKRGTSLPLAETPKDQVSGQPSAQHRVLVMSEQGPKSVTLSGKVALPEERPLTRAAFLRAAFAWLDTPYGWGGAKGGVDCSRFVLEVLESFGLRLPRNSAQQGRFGTFVVEVPEGTGDAARLAAIDRAAKRGIVLLQFDGHIGIYLGRDREGVPRLLHAFAEYRKPCKGVKPRKGEVAPETTFEVNRVTVSGLSLGEGTEKGSLLSRIARVAVLGHPPSADLSGVATVRPPLPIVPQEARRSRASAGLQCQEEPGLSLFVSPRVPHKGAPVRVVLTADEALAPGELSLVSPRGERVALSPRKLGGPPFGLSATFRPNKSGRWTAVFGEGKHLARCTAFRVRPGPIKPSEASGDGAWPIRRFWSTAEERLFAAFVEHLFYEPPSQRDSNGEAKDTWSNLHTLLRQQERNILHNHLGFAEDSELTLRPDCADLPYFLRLYFSWKRGLPFGFRRCSRGRTGRPPSCGELSTQEALPQEAASADPVARFARFARLVKNGVHSASARTAPKSSQTDTYPIPLERRWLRPGTVYADPHGHLLVVARYLPQTFERAGVLLAADAQPDGTIGRRTFWRGSFLFTPETKDVGAGFKAWRPVTRRKDDGVTAFVALDNEALRGKGGPSRREGAAPFSLAPYRESKDAFYARMDQVINPLPRPLESVIESRVAALHEMVERRIVSIDNGVDYLKSTGGKTIDMPKGYAIFETTGPWEDFATPARDMRLLIGIDTVIGFENELRASPQQFGVAKHEQLEKATLRAQKHIAELLEQKTFSYTASDDRQVTLNLKDIVERREALEMAYNPNDCIELRWGAPAASEEYRSCKRRAPAAQTKRMTQYRAWFKERDRPPR